MDDAMPQESHESEITWLRIIQVGRNAEEVDGIPFLIKEARTTKIVDAEPDMVKNLLPTNIRNEADMRKVKEALEALSLTRRCWK